jgi:hypothetical protein
VFDTDEPREVALIPAGRAPRAIVYPPGAAENEEKRAPRANQPVWVTCLTAAKGGGRSGTLGSRPVGLTDLLEVQVFGCHI